MSNIAIQRFRELRPDWVNVSDEEVAKAIGVPYTPPAGLENDFQRGVENYLPQTKEMVGAVGALAGEGLRRSLGEGPVGDWLRNSGKDLMASAKKEQLSRDTDSLTGAWDKGGLGAVLTDWLPYQVGQGVGNAAEMGASALAGAAVGTAAAPGAGTLAGGLAGAAGKTLLRKELVDQAKKIAVEKGEDAALRFISRSLGVNAGMMGSAAFHGAGETGGRAVEENGLENVDFAKLAPAAAGHAALEFVGDKVISGAMRPRAPVQEFRDGGGKAIAATFARDVAELGAKEMPVEIGQTALERAGAGMDLTSADAQREYIDAAGAAVGMGVGPAGVGAARSMLRGKGEEPKTIYDRLTDAAGDAGSKLGQREVRQRLEAGTLAPQEDFDFLNMTAKSAVDPTGLDDATLNAELVKETESKIQSASNYAKKILDNPDGKTDQELLAAQLFKQSLEKGESPEAALQTFTTTLDKERKYRAAKSSLFAAAESLKGERKGNAQIPYSVAKEGVATKGKWKGEEVVNVEHEVTPMGVVSDANQLPAAIKGEVEASDARAANYVDQIMGLVQQKLAPQSPTFAALQKDDPETALAMRGIGQWVKQGFEIDGKFKVPTQFIEALGEDAGKAIVTTYDLMLKQGMVEPKPGMGARVLNVARAIDKQVNADQGSLALVLESFTPLARQSLGNREAQAAMAKEVKAALDLLRAGQVKMTPAAKAQMKELFGPKTEKVLAAFTNRGVQQLDSETLASTGKSGRYEEDEWVPGVDFNEAQGMDTTGERTVFHGLGKNNVAFNIGYADKKTELAKMKAELAGRYPNGRIKEVGVIDEALDGFDYDGPNKVAKEFAEQSKEEIVDDLLRQYAKQVEGLAREEAVKFLNKNFRKLRVDVADNSDALDISPDQIGGFREPTEMYDKKTRTKKDISGPEHGRLFLETKDGEPFVTSTTKLLKHANGGKSITQAEGSRKIADKVMAALGSLLVADNSFTGRVGVKRNGEMEWFENGHALPQELLLTKQQLTTLNDAGHKSVPTERARLRGAIRNDAGELVVDDFGNVAKRPEKDPSATHKFTVADFADMTEQELTDYVAETQEKIDSMRKADLTDTDAYRILKSNLELANDHLEGTVDDVNPVEFYDRRTSVDEDLNRGETIERDRSTGEVAKPAPSGALVTGNDKKSKTALKSKEAAKSAPATQGDSHQERRLSGKQIKWVVDALRKGMPGFMAEVRALSKDRLAGVKAALTELRGVDQNDQRLPQIKDFAEFKQRVDAAYKVLVGTQTAEQAEAAAKKRAEAKREPGAEQVAKEFEDMANPPADADIAHLKNKIQSSKDSIESLKAKIDALKVKRVQEQLERAVDNEPNPFGAEARVRELQSIISDHELRIRMFERELAEQQKTDAAEESAEESVDRHYRSLIKSTDALPKGNKPVWALYQDDGDGNPTKLVGFSTNMDAARYVAEQDKRVLVNEMSNALRANEQSPDAKSGKRANERKGNAMAVTIGNELGKEGIHATHDSPIRHEGKFNWREHKGKGEGNSAFGAGTYLSTADGVHRSYKKQFTASMNKNHGALAEISELENQLLHVQQNIDEGEYLANISDEEGGLVQRYATRAAAEKGMSDIRQMSFNRIADMEKALTQPDKYNIPEVKKSIAFHKDKLERMKRWRIVDMHEEKKDLEAKIDELRRNMKVSPTYHVTVNAKPEELLDWDAPLSEQSEAVRKIIENDDTIDKAVFNQLDEEDPIRGQIGLEDRTGKEIYNALKMELGSQSKASDYLQSLGIVGHKYAASGGRNDKFPNYVIYDDSRIETNYVHFNEQSPDGNQTMSKEKQDEIRAEVRKVLGPDIEVQFKPFVMSEDGKTEWSGAWKDKLIEVSIGARSHDGVARHEAMHQLFKWLRDAGSIEVREILEKVAQNKLVMNQLERLLVNDKNAIAQLKTPEEAVAYLYQFWKSGDLKLGEKADTLFEKITKALHNVYLKTMAYAFGDIEAANELQMKADLRRAEAILGMFSDGAFAGGNKELLKAFDAKIQAQREQDTASFLKALSQSKVLQKAAFTAYSVLEDTGNPHFQRIARQFATKEGGKLGTPSLLEGTAQVRSQKLNVVNDLLRGYSKEEIDTALKLLQSREDSKNIHAPRIKALVDGIRKHFADMHDYMNQSGMLRWNEDTKKWGPIPEIKENYFPVVWSVEKIAADPDGFQKLLLDNHRDRLEAIAEQANEEQRAGKNAGEFSASANVKGRPITAEDVAQALTKRLINSAGHPDITESTSELGITPFARSVNKRILNWIDHSKFTDFMEDDLVQTLTNYTVQVVKRGEYVKRFGNEGERLNEAVHRAYAYELLGKDGVERAERLHEGLVAAWRDAVKTQPDLAYPTLKQAAEQLVPEKEREARVAETLRKIENPIKAIMAGEGTLGREIDENLRKVLSGVTVYQNMRLMMLSLFSSMVDPLGMMVRGGTMQDSWDGFVRGIKEIRNQIKGRHSTDSATKLAEMLGTVDASTYLDALGQTYSSIFIGGKMHRINDAIFRWNGMEAWNRAMRIQATQAAVGFIKRHLSEPNEHSERYLKDELGLDPAKTESYMKDGELDFGNPAVQAAVMRWVDGAILRPNAMQRPILASDPHYMIFYHLKQFAYSFHKTILRRAYVEAQHGNWSPTLALFAAYVPVMIAADAVKELLAPGDEPAWMKGGLGGYIEHGVSRANLFGVPQMGYEAIHSPFKDPARSATSAANLFGPTAGEAMGLLTAPFNDREALEDTTNLLPGAVLLNRMVR